MKPGRWRDRRIQGEIWGDIILWLNALICFASSLSQTQISWQVDAGLIRKTVIPYLAVSTEVADRWVAAAKYMSGELTGSA